MIFLDDDFFGVLLAQLHNGFRMLAADYCVVRRVDQENRGV